MTTYLLLAIALALIVYMLVAVVVARKSLRWNLRQGRSRRSARWIAIGAGLIWPLTIWLWEAEWLTTGRRSWRGDR
ncbi:MAG: hypothetical protein KY469_12205 [Actinobacteria bacterium]|nr:hypothetical protein [Actinomycetota bacterium]